MNAFDAPTLFIFIASLALFLIGINAALVYRFWPESWLIEKTVAVSGLLFYVSLSVLYGNPAMWRAIVGLIAIVVDFAAVVGIWHAMSTSKKGDGILVAYRRR